MQLRHAKTILPIAAIAALTLACSSGEQSDASGDSAAATDTAASAAATPAPAATSAASGPASLTVADIDRWQQGMAAELEAVRKAGTQLAGAKDGSDSLDALMAANEVNTRAAGAKAAGVDEDRYQLIRSTFAAVVAQMAPIEQEMDVSALPAAAVAELKKSREEGLALATNGIPSEVIEALRPRASALRKQDLTLAGERLKAAGMAR